LIRVGKGSNGKNIASKLWKEGSNKKWLLLVRTAQKMVFVVPGECVITSRFM